MKKKLFIAIMAVSFAALILSGCANKGAENFVKGYYKALAKGEMTAEKSYDEYISNVSKELFGITREKYMGFYASGVNTDVVKYDTINVTGTINFHDTIYKVKMDVKTNGDDNSGDKPQIVDYVINENGEYKFLQYGVQSKQQVDTNFSSNAFSVAIDAIYTGPDKIIVNLIANNPTTAPYAVGYGGNGKIVVQTDEGTFEKLIKGTNIIKPVDKNEGLQEIDGVKGNIKSIAIYNIYELNASGEPKDSNNSRSFVLYEQK